MSNQNVWSRTVDKMQALLDAAFEEGYFDGSGCRSRLAPENITHDGLKAAVAILRDFLQDSGGCDHSVGICVCDWISAFNAADAYVGWLSNRNGLCVTCEGRGIASYCALGEKLCDGCSMELSGRGVE